jgi:hypothetical protein
MSYSVLAFVKKIRCEVKFLMRPDYPSLQEQYPERCNGVAILFMRRPTTAAKTYVSYSQKDMSNVNGHIIVNTLIAVDIWKRGTDKVIQCI